MLEGRKKGGCRGVLTFQGTEEMNHSDLKIHFSSSAFALTAVLEVLQVSLKDIFSKSRLQVWENGRHSELKNKKSGENTEDTCFYSSEEGKEGRDMSSAARSHQFTHLTCQFSNVRRGFSHADPDFSLFCGPR